MARKEVELPELGEGVTEGELVGWLVKEGDTVTIDQPLAEVLTDKATVEIPSSMAGKVVELRGSEGDVIEVGNVIMVIEESTETAASPSNAKPASELPPDMPPPPTDMSQAVAAGPSPSPPKSSPTDSGKDLFPPAADSKVLAAPSTRRLAREMNIDINTINGTGLAGRVTREDVLKNTGAGATVAGQPTYSSQIPRLGFVSDQTELEERVALKGIRKKIAEKMQMAKHIVPHFTLMDEANVTELVELRTKVKAAAEERGIKVTYLPFVMKALIATIREFPMFNASIDDEASEIVYKKYFNIGFAADTPQGLLVPVIKNADQKTLFEVSKEIVELSGKAREGKLSLDEMKGATISITNIGSVGGTYATPIINHPEVAILGMYKISEKPVIKDGELDVIKCMNVTITADHRLIDGAVAANFLKAFVNRLENPGFLMMDMI